MASSRAKRRAVLYYGTPVRINFSIASGRGGHYILFMAEPQNLTLDFAQVFAGFGAERLNRCSWQQKQALYARLAGFDFGHSRSAKVRGALEMAAIANTIKRRLGQGLEMEFQELSDAYRNFGHKPPIYSVLAALHLMLEKRVDTLQDKNEAAKAPPALAEEPAEPEIEAG